MKFNILLLIVFICGCTDSIENKNGYLFIDFEARKSKFSSINTSIQAIKFINENGEHITYDNIEKPIDWGLSYPQHLSQLSLPEGKYAYIKILFDFSYLNIHQFSKDEFGISQVNDLQLITLNGQKIPEETNKIWVTINLKELFYVKKNQYKFLSIDMNTQDSMSFPYPFKSNVYVFDPKINIRLKNTTKVAGSISNITKDFTTIKLTNTHITFESGEFFLDQFPVNIGESTEQIKDNIVDINLSLDNDGQLIIERVNISKKALFFGQILTDTTGLFFSGHQINANSFPAFIDRLKLSTIKPSDIENQIDISNLSPGQLISFQMDKDQNTSKASDMLLYSTDVIARVIKNSQGDSVLDIITVEGKDSELFFGHTIILDAKDNMKFRTDDIVNFSGNFYKDDNGIRLREFNSTVIENENNSTFLQIYIEEGTSIDFFSTIDSGENIELPLTRKGEGFLFFSYNYPNYTLNQRDIESLVLNQGASFMLTYINGNGYEVEIFNDLISAKNKVESLMQSHRIYKSSFLGKKKNSQFLATSLQLSLMKHNKALNQTELTEDKEYYLSGPNYTQPKQFPSILRSRSMNFEDGSNSKIEGVINLYSTNPKKPNYLVDTDITSLNLNTLKSDSDDSDTSQEGRFWLDSGAGKRYYIKPNDQLRVNNEVLSSKLLQLAGINALNYEARADNRQSQISTDTTKDFLIISKETELNQINVNTNPDHKQLKPQIMEGLAAQFWISNQDINRGNLQVDTNNTIVWLDFGASLDRDPFGNRNYQFDIRIDSDLTGLDTTPIQRINSRSFLDLEVTGDILKNDQDFKKGVENISRISDQSIDKLVDKYVNSDGTEAKKIKNALKHRRTDMQIKFIPKAADPKNVNKFLIEKYGQSSYEKLKNQLNDEEKLCLDMNKKVQKEVLKFFTQKNIESNPDLLIEIYGKPLAMHLSEMSNSHKDLYNKNKINWVTNRVLALSEFSGDKLTQFLSNLPDKDQRNALLQTYFQNKYGNADLLSQNNPSIASLTDEDKKVWNTYMDTESYDKTEIDFKQHLLKKYNTLAFAFNNQNLMSAQEIRLLKQYPDILSSFKEDTVQEEWATNLKDRNIVFIPSDKTPSEVKELGLIPLGNKTDIVAAANFDLNLPNTITERNIYPYNYLFAFTNEQAIKNSQGLELPVKYLYAVDTEGLKDSIEMDWENERTDTKAIKRKAILITKNIPKEAVIDHKKITRNQPNVLTLKLPMNKKIKMKK